jgi:Flp pilus assembly pilin Flp
MKRNEQTSFKNRVRKFGGRLLRDQSGQTTTEYALLLLFVVVAVKAAGTGLKDRIKAVLDAAFKKTDEAITESQTQ